MKWIRELRIMWGVIFAASVFVGTLAYEVRVECGDVMASGGFSVVRLFGVTVDSVSADGLRGLMVYVMIGCGVVGVGALVRLLWLGKSAKGKGDRRG